MFALLRQFNSIFGQRPVSMKTEKKCPGCGEWTTWQKQPTDRCAHCNALLDPEAHEEKLDREEKERIFKENDFFRVREDDSFLMITVRKVGWVLHAIFAAITWAFLWFVTTFSG
jgi:methionyl-tRNA synthetase